MIGRNFQIFCSDYWEMQLQVTKSTFNSFTHSFQSTFSLRFLSSLPGKGKLLILLQAAFFKNLSSQQESCGAIM